ncbi:MAG: DUF1080 domain-containing protein [Akkermansiaceae bacterium]|jgi:hypothetical protein
MIKIACTLALAASVAASRADDGWVSIFDGETLKGWTNSKGGEVQEGAWVAEDGVLHRKAKGGDLYSAREYADFEFRWEWKISPKGNSGVKYRVTQYGNQLLGPEYQVLDDAHPDGAKSVKRQAGSLYDLLAANDKKKLNPVGEWNSSRVVVKGKHLQHYLNGELVVDVVVGSDRWKEAHKKSKFKGKEDFAHNASGRIYLQDHGDEVWYRKLEIKELK